MFVSRGAKLRSYALVAGLVVVATIVAACSSSTQPSSKAPTSATFVYVVPGVPTGLDYNPYAGDPTRYAAIPLQSKLVLYDPSKLKDQGCSVLASISDLKGDLAESWSYNADRSVVTFKLRDVKSEYGNPLTADDVKWSIDRTIANSSIARFDYFTISDYEKSPMQVVDTHTVALHVVKPTSLDVVLMTLFLSIIYDSKEAKTHATPDDPWANKWMATHTDTFGPWKVDSFDPGQQVTYVPNPNYYGKRGNITKLIIRAVPDASVRAQLLQSGDADWAARLPFDTYKSLTGANGVTVQQCVSPNRDDLVLQQKDPRFADVRVRQAISMAIDRSALVKGAYLGYGKPAVTGLTQNYQFTLPSDKYTYDPNAAKQLLAQAGYPNGFSFTMLYSESRPGPWVTQSATLVKDQLSKIGLQVTLQNVPGATDFSNAFLAGKFDAVMWQEPPLVADPYFSAAIYNVSNSFQNNFGFKDPKYDALVQQIATSPAGPDRDKLVTQLAAMGVTDYPVIYLTDDAYLNAHRSNIHGYLARPDGDLYPQEFTKG